MKIKYTIEIQEDTDEGTFAFSLQRSNGSDYDPENLAGLLVEVAGVIAEESKVIQGATIH